MNEISRQGALMVLQQAFDSSFGIAVRVESFGKDLTSISLRGKGIIYAVRESGDAKEIAMKALNWSVLP